MRRFTRKEIHEMDLSEIEFDLKSRDDIPQLLRGLQYIFLTPSLREEVRHFQGELKATKISHFQDHYRTCTDLRSGF